MSNIPWGGAADWRPCAPLRRRACNSHMGSQPNVRRIVRSARKYDPPMVPRRAVCARDRHPAEQPDEAD
eukprot:356724-Chlamydomonas_euryale.AAC.3